MWYGMHNVEAGRCIKCCCFIIFFIHIAYRISHIAYRRIGSVSLPPPHENVLSLAAAFMLQKVDAKQVVQRRTYPGSVFAPLAFRPFWVPGVPY